MGNAKARKQMLPAIVLPLHDPQGRYLPHLERVTPVLKTQFAQVFVSVSPATERAQEAAMQQLAADPFFRLNFNQPDTQFGDHYLAGYRNALPRCLPDQVLHLCDVDKVTCYLQGEDSEQFIADIQAVTRGPLPLLFQRSTRAWNTYPSRYREIEQWGIRIGELLFQQSYDFAWSHLVIRAHQLAQIIPLTTQRTTGLLAEIVLLLREQLQTQTVDWLVWEDPFIYGREAEQLKRERDESPLETRKRLQGMRPILELLLKQVT